MDNSTLQNLHSTILEKRFLIQSVCQKGAYIHVMKILKSQKSKLVAISTKLSICENKTDLIMTKLDELT